MQRLLFEECLEERVSNEIDTFNLGTIVLYTPPYRPPGPVFCGTCGGVKNPMEDFRDSSLPPLSSQQDSLAIVGVIYLDTSTYRPAPYAHTPILPEDIPEFRFNIPEVKMYESPTLPSPLDNFRETYRTPPDLLLETPQYPFPPFVQESSFGSPGFPNLLRESESPLSHFGKSSLHRQDPLEMFRATYIKDPEPLFETPRYKPPSLYLDPEPFGPPKPLFEIPPYEPPKIPEWEFPKTEPSKFQAYRDLLEESKPLISLYEPPKREGIGLLNAEDFQFGYALGEGVKVSFHGISETRLTHSHVKLQGSRDPLKEFNGYESAILDIVLQNNFKRFT